MSETSDSDLWDDAGPFLYQHLPEDCLAAFFTEERDMVQITPERDGYWLSDTGTQGATRYDTLADAKAAGDEMIAAAEAAQDLRLLTEAGLSPEAWTVSYEDGVRFESKTSSLWIASNSDGISTRESWSLYDGDDELVRNARSIAPAVTEALRRLALQAA